MFLFGEERERERERESIGFFFLRPLFSLPPPTLPTFSNPLLPSPTSSSRAHRFIHPPLPTNSAALGLESISIPALDKAVAASSSSSSTSTNTPLSRQAAALADADAAFESSELLRTLKERTAANAETNKKAITDKYCLRQSELGVGDCAGLRLIPGATKSGKQKTPKLLAKLIGKEDAIDAYNNNEANDAAIAAVEKMRKSAAP